MNVSLPRFSPNPGCYLSPCLMLLRLFVCLFVLPTRLMRLPIMAAVVVSRWLVGCLSSVFSALVSELQLQGRWASHSNLPHFRKEAKVAQELYFITQ